MNKHKPIIEIKEEKIVITIGDTLHPMTKKEHIEWIELDIDGKISRKYLKLNEKPIAKFEIPEDYDQIVAKAHCNKHGEWKTEI